NKTHRTVERPDRRVAVRFLAGVCLLQGCRAPFAARPRRPDQRTGPNISSESESCRRAVGRRAASSARRCKGGYASRLLRRERERWLEGESAPGYLTWCRVRCPQRSASSGADGKSAEDSGRYSNGDTPTLVPARRSRCGPGSKRVSESFR